MSQAKDEALRALEHIRDRLASADHGPLLGLERAQLGATVEYAMEQVRLIPELKRARRRAGVEGEM